MTDNALARYLRGGAAGRSDSISGLSPDFQNALLQMMAEAPDGYLTINSAYRSPELQRQLWDDAVRRYGSEAEARRWVAPPGRSQHNHGMAVDLGFSGPEATAWAHENAQRFGLSFPLSNEDWHLELASARGGPQPPASGAPTAPPNALAAIGQAAPAPQAGASAEAQGPRGLPPLDPSAFMARPYDTPSMAELFARYLPRYQG